MDPVDGVVYSLGREVGALVLAVVIAAVVYGLRRLVGRRNRTSQNRRWASSFVVGFALALIGGFGAAGAAIAEGSKVQGGLLVPSSGMVAAFVWWIVALRRDPATATPAATGVGGTPPP